MHANLSEAELGEIIYSALRLSRMRINSVIDVTGSFRLLGKSALETARHWAMFFYELHVL